MARKRRPTREELERQAQIELERSMGRSLGSQGSPYSSPPGPGAGPPPAWEHDAGPREPEPAGPPAWQQEPGPPGEDERFSRPTAAEEEAAVTELALQQWAERRGGGPLETHVVNRMQPSQAEAARDQALREALARQQRFASPIRRAPVPQSKERGFSNSWTSSSPSAAHEEPMMWESAIPG
ncbi:MAG: hypothetical protein KY441_06595, partial [Actinobacteria bacterium]|nr:hypothetical protein [Actinomycetota bacterium]